MLQDTRLGVKTCGAGRDLAQWHHDRPGVIFDLIVVEYEGRQAIISLPQRGPSPQMARTITDNDGKNQEAGLIQSVSAKKRPSNLKNCER